jgi:hypothetical protein
VIHGSVVVHLSSSWREAGKVVTEERKEEEGGWGRGGQKIICGSVARCRACNTTQVGDM